MPARKKATPKIVEAPQPVLRTYLSMEKAEGNRYQVKEAVIDVANDKLVELNDIGEAEPRALAKDRLRREIVKRYFR